MTNILKNARYIEVSAEVRYWEDAYLNGVEDKEGHIPLRKGSSWEPVIELATGRVQDWPQGVTANVHYKVCDQGVYWLLDESRTRMAKWKGHYVPDKVLCVGVDGYGDYIIFTIEGDGLIKNWKAPYLNPEQWVCPGRINGGLS